MSTQEVDTLKKTSPVLNNKQSTDWEEVLEDDDPVVHLRAQDMCLIKESDQRNQITDNQKYYKRKLKNRKGKGKVSY